MAASDLTPKVKELFGRITAQVSGNNFLKLREIFLLSPDVTYRIIHVHWFIVFSVLYQNSLVTHMYGHKRSL